MIVPKRHSKKCWVCTIWRFQGYLACRNCTQRKVCWGITNYQEILRLSMEEGNR